VSRDATPADGARPALKREAATLDSGHAMRTQELKRRVERAEYVVDPEAVADAMLRHALSQRRWWNPLADRSMPASDSTTPGSPERTAPTQVSGAAASAAARSAGATQTHNS
jgi:hypothetical protein